MFILYQHVCLTKCYPTNKNILMPLKNIKYVIKCLNAIILYIKIKLFLLRVQFIFLKTDTDKRLLDWKY